MNVDNIILISNKKSTKCYLESKEKQTKAQFIPALDTGEGFLWIIR